MSAIRRYAPDGKPIWQPVDTGAVGRIHHSRGSLGAGVVVVPQSRAWPDVPAVTRAPEQAPKAEASR